MFGQHTISAIINNICKKHKIDYKSPNYSQFCGDVGRLGVIYLEAKILLGELLDMAERHQLKSIVKSLKHCAEGFNNISHEIRNVATKMNCEEMLLIKKDKNVS